MSETTAEEIQYFVSLIIGKLNMEKENKIECLSVKIYGERSETNVLKLKNDYRVLDINDFLFYSKEDFIIEHYKLLMKNVGKVKSLHIGIDEAFDQYEKYFFLDEIQLEIPNRNECFIFPIQRWIDTKTSIFLEPNLLPGQTGVHYAVSTHTDSKQLSNIETKIFMKIIGNFNKTEFIPLQRSQTNKHQFSCGKRDVFDIVATDVGHIKRIIIRNENHPGHSWYFDSLEIRTINDGHVYNFTSVNKTLHGKESIELTPINNLEVSYEVVLRTAEMDNIRRCSMSMSHYHLPDVYLILYGTKDRTKKIYLNNYEIKKKDNDILKEKYFDFKWEDIGKINRINLSVNENGNPFDCLYIDFIEIKIPAKSEAYKFPVERGLGEYIEDGKCELDLEVWKHPEMMNHIEYEVSLEFDIDQNYEDLGTLYIRIHGNQGKTAKIKLIDEDFLDTKDIEIYEFVAPDCGKISKIQLFYVPKTQKCVFLLESIEIKVKSRNEAYRFPINSYMGYDTRFIELEPWRKPSLLKNNI